MIWWWEISKGATDALFRYHSQPQLLPKLHNICTQYPASWCGSSEKQWKNRTETDCNLWVIVLKSKRNFNVRLLRREAAKLLRAYHARCGQNFAFDPRRASKKAYLQGLIFNLSRVWTEASKSSFHQPYGAYRWQLLLQLCRIMEHAAISLINSKDTNRIYNNILQCWLLLW